MVYFAVGPGGTHASDIYSLGLTLKAGKRDKELMASLEEEAKATASADDEAFEEREWQAAALEEALRRIKSEVNPEHYAAFVANAIEGQDTANRHASLRALPRQPVPDTQAPHREDPRNGGVRPCRDGRARCAWLREPG